MELTLDCKPLSNNRMWRGRRFKTEEYQNYEATIRYLLPKQSVSGLVVVSFRFFIKNWSRSDVDNFLKPLLDCIVKAGLIDDDRKVVRLIAEKIKSEKDYIEIDVQPYQVTT